MRLLHTRTLLLKEFFQSSVPAFAILSHTWEDDEVSFQDIQILNIAQRKAGFTKIKSCCDEAARLGLEWAWIDTCCIDKSSSAELSEAINSMYNFYQDAEICFAYLSDVLECTNINDRIYAFGRSKWFTRGWTLQELIAPTYLVFYNNAWKSIGTKYDYRANISEVTGIDEHTLAGRDTAEVSVAKRMFWASRRRTTRIEDMAYCLLGIFGVNMPLLYGEGKTAFVRLQEEIMKDSEDHSLFSWKTLRSNGGEHETRGLLAESPAEFTFSGGIVPLQIPGLEAPYAMTNRGLRITLPLLPHNQNGIHSTLLACVEEKDLNFLAIDLEPVSLEADKFRRVNPAILRTIPFNRIPEASIRTVYVKNERANPLDHKYYLGNAIRVKKLTPGSGYHLSCVFPDDQWDDKNGTFRNPKVFANSVSGLLLEGKDEMSFAVALGFEAFVPWCNIIPLSEPQTLEHALIMASRNKFTKVLREQVGSRVVAVTLTSEVIGGWNTATVDITINKLWQQ
jgi:hypothetical protein